MTHPRIIWLISDGKPGHENQSLGLSDAISRRVPTQVERISLEGLRSAPSRVLHALKTSNSLPRPDLILGAGHATHFTLLSLARQTGAPCIVLMRPSLPSGLFDLCLVPLHDLKSSSLPPNILPTRGALNRVHTLPNQPRPERWILLGGPSNSHGWDDSSMLAALEAIELHHPGWSLTDSRRTPSGFRHLIKQRCRHLHLVPHEETSRGWLPERLAASSEIWVTEDSVSMIYEALSSGAKVGLLPVPRKRSKSRVIQGIDQLAKDGYLTTFADWQKTGTLTQSAPPLAEADRCAGLILQQWFPELA